ncbi:GerAB/ArcD/ProY family transporter [Bacillus marinisedimentorum]|uniref:GerAB/ArcD/ProY family transporter n=1 Tax=Bacillus marinisedimentorum TaxID=1821260 RepID=UPI000871DCBD|nr:endospore germination permease [Bacillus marinisedimentorum]
MEPNRIHISPFQFTLLVFMFVTGSSILLTPLPLIKAAKQDAWIAAVAGVLMGLAVIALYIYIGKSYPGKTFFEFIDEIFGKFLGKVITGMYLFFVFLLSAQVLSNLGDFIVSQIMIETPKEYIHALFLVPVLYAAVLGLESYSRAAEALLPSLLLLIIIFMLVLLPDIDFSNLTPVNGEGALAIFEGSLAVLQFPYIEMFLLLALFPFVYSPEEAGKAFMIGGIAGGFILIINPLFITLVLGSAFAETVLYPSFILAKKVSIGDFLERVEVLLAAIWIITLFFKLIVCFHITVKGVNYLTGLKSSNLLIFPIGIIVWVTSIIVYPNFAYFQSVVASTLSYKLVFGLILPAVMGIITFVKKKQKNKQPAQGPIS